MEGNVKLKDIAEALGISVVTVSNGLSGKKGVSEALRQEIVAKAQELGYDLQKYENKGNGSAKIGVIMSGRNLEIGTSFYWALYQQVVCAASEKQGFTMLEMLDQDGKSQRELPKLLSEGVIQGLIVIGKVERQYLERILATARVPVVLLDFCEPSIPCDAVMSSNYLGMYQATRYLLERGHRNIAFVGSVTATDNIRDRYYGYCKGLAEYGIPVQKEWVLEDRDPETGLTQVELPEHMPTAFACNCDVAAGVLYDRLVERGYRVPEDVSVIGYDDYLLNHPFADKLTTYHVDMGEMAKTAVKILLKKLRKNDKYRGVRYLDGTIIERSSVLARTEEKN